MSYPRKVAILRALQLGDLLVAVPALRSIRAGFPEAEITLIGLPWAASFASRFSHYIDRFVEFPGFPGLRELPVDPTRTARFIREQRDYGYDLAIQMHGSGQSSNPCALALGARETAGFVVGEPPTGLSISAPYPDDLPEIQRNLQLARLLGCPDLGPDLEFPLWASDEIEADLLLAAASGNRPRIAIHPGARSPARRWSIGRFAAVADALVREYGSSIFVTGGPDEIEVGQAMARAMTEPSILLAGMTSIGGLGALVARMDLFISNDTGPAHIAVATGTPSVTIFGPADPSRWAPLEPERHPIVRKPVECSPCAYWDCPIDHRCLEWIESAEVIDAAMRLLARRNVEASV